MEPHTKRILRDYKNGYTIEGVAKKYRIPFIEAYLLIANSSLEIRLDKQQRAKRDEAIVRFYKKNKSLIATAEIMKMNIELIRSILIKEGVKRKDIRR